MSNFEYISYINDCFKDGKLLRWSDKSMPLTVFVAPFRWYKAKDEEYEYYAMIQDALSIWERVSNHKIKFEMVANLYDSQINIDWKRADRQSLGHCSFNFDPKGRLYSAEVSIGLSDGIIHQQYQSKDEVFHTIIHEIGHALGLQHSPFKNDIMYVPHQYGVTKISNRDIITLKWLYNFTYGVTRQDILSHYKLSSGYDLDKLIYHLETNTSPENIEEKPVCADNESQLKYEQNTLAEFNKFNMSIQNLGISSDTKEYFKKLKINKNFKNK